MTTPALNLPSTETLASAVAALDGWMIDTLGALVAAPSPSGAEQPAVAVFEQCLLDLGLASERIVLDQTRQAESPLFSCPCDPDGGRYNLLARHLMPQPGAARCCSTAISMWCPPGPRPSGSTRRLPPGWWTVGCTDVARVT